MTNPSPNRAQAQPGRDCPLCPRLVELRETQRALNPGWFNAPVPDFGDPEARLAIVGLAPGLSGANRTGRPFTGDHAGGLLYQVLGEFGLVQGEYGGTADDGLRLRGAIIMNAVRCVPPQNKPTPAEIHMCRPFLIDGLGRPPRPGVVVALGQIAHQSAVKALGGKLPKYRFAHGAEHRMPDGTLLIDSYHCSRYNQNTGRLTTDMLRTIFARAVELAAA